MMYSIEYSKRADKTLRKWKKSNPSLFREVTAISSCLPGNVACASSWGGLP